MRHVSMPLSAKLWLAAVGLLIAVGVAASVMLPLEFERTVAIGSVEGVERLADIDLPSDTVLVNAQYSAPAGSQGRCAWAVLRMSPASARSFLKGPPFEGVSSDRRQTDDREGRFFDTTIQDWHPDDAAEFLSAWTGMREHGEWGVSALADMDDETVSIVYLRMGY